MDYAVIISAIVLGLSVLATAAKFLDWFVHSDPQTMVRVSRWIGATGTWGLSSIPSSKGKGMPPRQVDAS